MSDELWYNKCIFHQVESDRSSVSNRRIYEISRETTRSPCVSFLLSHTVIRASSTLCSEVCHFDLFICLAVAEEKRPGSKIGKEPVGDPATVTSRRREITEQNIRIPPSCTVHVPSTNMEEAGLIETHKPHALRRCHVLHLLREQILVNFGILFNIPKYLFQFNTITPVESGRGHMCCVLSPREPMGSCRGQKHDYALITRLAPTWLWSFFPNELVSVQQTQTRTWRTPGHQLHSHLAPSRVLEGRRANWKECRAPGEVQEGCRSLLCNHPDPECTRSLGDALISNQFWNDFPAKGSKQFSSGFLSTGHKLLIVQEEMQLG